MKTMLGFDGALDAFAAWAATAQRRKKPKQRKRMAESDDNAAAGSTLHAEESLTRGQRLARAVAQPATRLAPKFDWRGPRRAPACTRDAPPLVHLSRRADRLAAAAGAGSPAAR